MDVPTLEDEWEPPRPPSLWNLPSAQSSLDELIFLEQRLGVIRSECITVVSALALRTYISQRWKIVTMANNSYDLPREWGWIAAREGIMSLYHFWKAIEKLPIFEKINIDIDMLSIREARKRFRNRWPKIEKLRNAISHQAEIRNTKEKAELHEIELQDKNQFSPLIIAGDGQGARVSIGAGLIGGVYHTTFNGEHLTCDLTPAGAKELIEIVKIIFSAFEGSRSH